MSCGPVGAGVVGRGLLVAGAGGGGATVATVMGTVVIVVAVEDEVDTAVVVDGAEAPELLDEQPVAAMPASAATDTRARKVVRVLTA